MRDIDWLALLTSLKAIEGATRAPPCAARKSTRGVRIERF